MMREIESANSPPTATSPSSPPRATMTATATPSSNFSPSQRMQKSECFCCKKQGHWARDCPSKSPKKSTSSTGGGPNRDVKYPSIQCPCGHGPCTISVSQTERNYNREFYTCPERGTRKCGYFKWCDTVKEKDINLSAKVVPPKCPCGAGVCSRFLETSGPNVGRGYFVCPIKKGLGACLFFQWEHTLESNKVNEHVDKSRGYGSPQSTCDSHQVFDIENNDLQNNDDLSAQQPRRNGSSAPKVDSVQDFSKLVVLPTSSAEDGMLNENRESGRTANILTIDHDDPPLCVTPQIESSTLDSAKGDPVMLEEASVLQIITQSEIHLRQMDFWQQFTAAGEISSTDFIYQKLGLRLLGWLGRLAFPPSRCLKDCPPTPFFCGIFPAFDAIIVPQDRDVLNPGGSTPLQHKLSISDLGGLSPPITGQVLQLRNGDPQKPSGLKRSCSTMEGGSLSRRISESFEQMALFIQNQLVQILNSIDPYKHDEMTSAADEFFSVLNAMPIDYRPFAQRVKEFINSAARLSCIEQSFCNNQSFQELLVQYNGAKVRVDDISRAHVKAMDAFTASNQRLQLLREEATQVRERLLQIENQLSCCEAETSQLKTNIDMITGDKLEALRKMEKAEEALKLCEQREEERLTAKAALEKICQSMKEVCGLHLRKRQRL